MTFASDQPSDQPRKGGLRVLVVEDNADSADSTAVMLRCYGHEVAIARDGVAALELARACYPDVILLDIGLPDLNGWEVAQSLTQSAPTGRPPLLVAVTGYGKDSDRCQSQAAGIHLHLVKPVDPEKLQGVLQRFHRTIS
jgi:CheY-like chemotaxis protein